MPKRTGDKQSEHDAAVHAVKQIYEQKGKHAWTNPGSQKNKSWNSRYIDIIAVEEASADRAWVIEVETDDSVSSSEACNQWQDYDQAYKGRWYLAVPVGSKNDALSLLEAYSIKHCKVISWQRNPDGTHTFWGLPLGM